MKFGAVLTAVSSTFALAPASAHAAHSGGAAAGQVWGRASKAVRIVDVSSPAGIPAARASLASERTKGVRIVYRLRHVFTEAVTETNKCLDADANTLPANGTKVQIWDCNNAANQVWYMSEARNAPSPDYYNLQVGAGSQPYKCLDADANTLPADGTKVQLWDCNGGANQLWEMDLRRSPDWFFNLAASKCLDVDANTLPANGTKVQIWACHRGSNQLWEISG